MSSFVLISVLLSVIVTSSSETVTCPANEELKTCPDKCAFDNCPKDALADRAPCTKYETCTPACRCGFNYRRADNGTCIPTTDCPPFECPANEVFDPCPSYCPSDDCRDALLGGQCPYLLLIVVYCSPTCRCADGYFRKDGICVPFEECPIVQQLRLKQRGAITEETTLPPYGSVPEKRRK